LERTTSPVPFGVRVRFSFVPEVLMVGVVPLSVRLPEEVIAPEEIVPLVVRLPSSLIVSVGVPLDWTSRAF